MTNRSHWLIPLLSLVLAFVVVAWFASAQSQAQTPAATGTAMAPGTSGASGTSSLPRTITVVGNGMVKAQPDIARVTVGVETVGPTAQQASDQARTDMDKVLATLKQQGVVDKDVQTSGYNIYVEQPPRPGNAAATTVESKPIYHVSNEVLVTVRDLTKTGPLLDAVVASGANNIYGVSFDVADRTPFQSQARQMAVSDAQTHAAELAKAASVQIGDVVSISEVVGNVNVTPNFRLSAAPSSGGGPTPINPGELEVSEQVQVVYAIR
jgi:uncharacterized protein